MKDAELSVPEIHCDHCKASIESAVGDVNGVDTVNVVVGDRSVQVNYDGADQTYSEIVQAIEDQGYTVG